MTLSFNAATHVYEVDGKAKASATSILRAVGLYDSYEFAEDYHRYRGSAVHSGAAILDLGGEPRLGPVPFNLQQVGDEIVNGYWPAFSNFKQRCKWQGYIWECPMIGRDHAGCFDSVGLMDADPTLIDVKSGSMPDMVPVQLAMYWLLITKGLPVSEDHPGLNWLRELVESGRKVKRAAVRLEKSGRDTLFSETRRGESYDSDKWIHAANSALTLFRLVPGHEYVDVNGVKKSHLSDLRWVAAQVKDRLTGKDYDACQRAGSNLWNLREAYNLL
jgi:hypothetical protein